MPYALSYSQVVLADSPAGYWRLGDANPTTAADSSGNGRDGTYAAGVLTGQTGPLINELAGAALFDGVTGGVSVPDANGLDLADTLTVEAWIKATAAGASGTVVDKGANAYLLSLASGAPAVGKSGASTIATATVTLNDLAWHHVVWTKSGATTVIYVDSVNRTGAVTDATLADTALALGIGRLSGGASPLKAYLDEVAVYPTALTAARVLAHFNAGLAIVAGSTPLPTKRQYAAVLFNPGVASPDRWVRYASYGAGVLTPGTKVVGVEIVTAAQAEQRPTKRVVALTRFAPGTAIPPYYKLISEQTAD